MDDENSLSDEATFAGAAKRRPAAEISLGDERTLGDRLGDHDTVIDDIEVVDLEARYKVEGTLGQGGMGEVLLAIDARLDRKVAIKRILGDAAKSKTAIMRFLTEAKAIAALNHPNIVQIYDYGRAKDGPFLIMEYVDGGSLLDRCRDSALPLDEAIDLACQLCDGLAKAHDLGIIHRDIKPANVLLTKDGTPKLTDFGLAKAEAGDHGQTMTGAVLGTPDFMPPEQRHDASLVDQRSDLWSLAATVYQMVTGRSPKVIRLHELPQALQPVMARALEDAKDARYQSAREFRDALKTGLRSAAPATAVATVGEGQCPACGVQNDATRKFCRGCGASLFAPCLACTQPMPIWEDICGSCGGKQTPLVETRRADMAAAQATAEGLLGDFEFDKAVEIVTALRDEPNPRLSHLREWAEQFLRDIDKGRQEQVSRAIAAVNEALAHEKAYDYAAGVRAIDPLPHAVRALRLPAIDVTAGQLLDQLDQKLRTSKSLESTIRAAIKDRALSGLLKKVIALANLRPDRPDLAKLREQLKQRQAALTRQRDALVQQARQAITKQDYAAAIKLLSQVDEEVVNFEVGQLCTDARQKEDCVVALRDHIKAGVAANQYEQLLPTIEEYLTLKPITPELDKIRAQAVTAERRTVRRKRMKRVMVTAAVVCIVASWIGMQAWRNAKERHLAAIEAAKAKHAADVKAALKAEKWDDVISLDSENGQAYVGRAKARLETSPPDVEGAFADIERASRIGIDEEASDLKSLKAKAHSLRAMDLASDGRLDEATKDLVAAKELGAGWTVLRGAEELICKGWVARVERASSEGNLAALQAATAAAVSAGDKSQRLSDAWRKFAASRIAEADAKGLGIACEELAKLRETPKKDPSKQPTAPEPFREEADWWFQLGVVVGGERGDAVVVQSAIQAAKAAGVADDVLAPLRARAMMIDAVEMAASDKLADAATRAIEASFVDSSIAKRVLAAPANVGLKQATAAQFREEFDTAISAGDWDGAINTAAAAGAIDAESLEWPGAAISSHPGGISAVPVDVVTRLAPAAFAVLPPLRNSVGIELKLLAAGTFRMGQAGGKSDEIPHDVTLTKLFYIGVCEVTNSQWERVMGSVPSCWKDADRPVETVSWADAVEFCQKLSALPEEQKAGRVYRLPTEAEWEYACRAGTTTQWSFGDDASRLVEYGWFSDNSGGKTQLVGKKKPNAWGLFDMHGNVSEWCSDWYGDFVKGAVTDPPGPSGGSFRVVRGGSWRSPAGKSRSASRVGEGPSFRLEEWGLRLALNSALPGKSQIPDGTERLP